MLWSKAQQGFVLSSFFWGYLFSQLIFAKLIVKAGAKVVIGISIFLSSVVTLLSPVAANIHVIFFMAMRIIMGFVQVRRPLTDSI